MDTSNKIKTRQFFQRRERRSSGACPRFRAGRTRSGRLCDPEILKVVKGVAIQAMEQVAQVEQQARQRRETVAAECKQKLLNAQRTASA